MALHSVGDRRLIISQVAHIRRAHVGWDPHALLSLSSCVVVKFKEENVESGQF